MEHQGEIILYQPDEAVKLEVRLEDETVWLTQAQIAELFGTEVPAISKHIRNIIRSGELEKEATVSKMEIVRLEGSRKVKRVIDIYNLDMILSIGYRVNSRNATQFRRWANKVLKEYLLKGYSINQRINQLENKMESRLAAHDRQLEELTNKVDFLSVHPFPRLRASSSTARSSTPINSLRILSSLPDSRLYSLTITLMRACCSC